jgi:hypothetical protein
MRELRRSTAFAAGGALALATAFAACAVFGGGGVFTSGSGSSPMPGGRTAAWLESMLGSPGPSETAGWSASAEAGSSGTADATNGAGQTAGPHATATPAGSASSGLGSTQPPAPAPTPTPTPTLQPTSGGPCYTFPSSNVWNKRVDGLPVASNSTAMINAIGQTAYLHPDYSAAGDGIPFNVVGSSTPRYSVSFDYADESDPGPYPIPSSPRIERGSDAHMLMVDTDACMLYELYAVSKSGSSWSAGSGAIWNMRSNALRPDGWTSADAAGLPIYPGLVRYYEVSTGAINHAIRFTAPNTCGHIYPARHQTAPACSNLPPMGLRVRLKASVDISGFGPNARVVLTALKRYGMMLADNGSPWFITGAPDSRWNDDEMHQLHNLHGSDFEVVNTSSLRNG